MKIKLAILERDDKYLNRLASVFNTKYADKFEIYSFTNLEVALTSLHNSRIDVFIASDVFEIDITKLPKKCGFAYLVNSADIEILNNQRAICKFQKVDLIYKQILSIYSDCADNMSGIKLGDDNCKIILFTSASGGVGSSSVAAACAVHFAAKGNKTLYLNFEKYGSADAFFSAEGQFDMSDIIFALKSKKSNLSLKLESCVKQDHHGVFFYSQSKIALDMLEMEADDILRLISELKLSGSYDYIIIDTELGLDRDSLKVMQQASSIVWIGDGSQISNIKLDRAYCALKVLEQNEDSAFINRIRLIYNKFSNKTSQTLINPDIKIIGGAPRYEHASTTQVIDQLSAMEIFEKI